MQVWWRMGGWVEVCRIFVCPQENTIREVYTLYTDTMIMIWIRSLCFFLWPWMVEEVHDYLFLLRFSHLLSFWEVPANVLTRLKRKSITYGHPPQIIHSSVLYTGEYEAPSRYFKESAPSERGFLWQSDHRTSTICRYLYYGYNKSVKDAYRA